MDIARAALPLLLVWMWLCSTWNTIEARTYALAALIGCAVNLVELFMPWQGVRSNVGDLAILLAAFLLAIRVAHRWHWPGPGDAFRKDGVYLVRIRPENPLHYIGALIYRTPHGSVMVIVGATLYKMDRHTWKWASLPFRWEMLEAARKAGNVHLTRMQIGERPAHLYIRRKLLGHPWRPWATCRAADGLAMFNNSRQTKPICSPFR